MAALFLNDGSGSGGQAGGHLIQVRTCECALAQSAVGWTGMHLYACVYVYVCVAGGQAAFLSISLLAFDTVLHCVR